MKATKYTALALSALLCVSACTEIDYPDPTFTESGYNSVTSPTQTDNTEPPTTTTSVSQAAETADTSEITAENRPTVNESIDYAAFDARIEEIARSLNVVGMGLCVFAEGEVIYSTNYGCADREAGIPTDDNTLYRTASVSKMISTMVLMTLYDQGVLEVDSQLEPLTGISYNNPALDKPVLLRHLLTHTSGLADGETYNTAYQYKYDLEYVLSKSYSGYEPGTLYSYSNLGAGTIGAIIEKLTGEFFHYYADKALFKPLGMDAGYCADLISARHNAANLYQGGELAGAPKTWGRSTAYYESYGLGNSYHTAQCELLITPTDLARLGIVLAGDGSVDGVRVLSEEAVNAMNATYYTNNALPFDMGLCVRKYNGNLVKGRTIHGHPGQALGSVNGLYYDPSDGTGVAICSTGCDPSFNVENEVYTLLDECVNTVYKTFFS